MNEHEWETIPIDEHWFAYWVGLVALAIAATLVVVGLVRERRHRAYSARESRNVDMRVVGDSTLQRRIGYAFAVVALAAIAFGVTQHVRSVTSFTANVLHKYPDVRSLDGVQQTGSSFIADVTYEDGSTKDAVLFLVEGDSEPVREDDLGKGPVNPNLQP